MDILNILNQIFAIIFYVLFFYWVFLKIRNAILIKKLNCKEAYKNMKKELKNQKLSKYLFRIIITCTIILAIYPVSGIIVLFLSILLMILFPLGFIYPDLYESLSGLISVYFSLAMYIGYFIYIIVYMILVRAIYINILCYKGLTSDDILN